MQVGVRDHLLEVAGVGKLHFQLAGPQLETGCTTVAHKVDCIINKTTAFIQGFHWLWATNLELGLEAGTRVNSTDREGHE